MLPSVSAYTMPCAGDVRPSAASRNSAQLVARSRAKIASAVVLGASPVQAIDTA
jgi:hypothetical protein